MHASKLNTHTRTHTHTPRLSTGGGGDVTRRNVGDADAHVDAAGVRGAESVLLHHRPERAHPGGEEGQEGPGQLGAQGPQSGRRGERGRERGGAGQDGGGAGRGGTGRRGRRGPDSWELRAYSLEGEVRGPGRWGRGRRGAGTAGS